MSFSPLSEAPLKTKLFSIEMMIYMLVTAVTASGIWFGMIARVDASDKEIKDIKSMQAVQGRDIQAIKVSNAVILQRLTEAERRDKERADQTQRILEIVEKVRAHGDG